MRVRLETLPRHSNGMARVLRPDDRCQVNDIWVDLHLTYLD